MQDMIFVAMKNWTRVWCRNKLLAAEFARRAPGHRILFVGLAHDVSHDLRKGNVGTLLRALFWLNPHYALHMVGHVGEHGVVYDIGDDWTKPDQKEWPRRLVIAGAVSGPRRARL